MIKAADEHVGSHTLADLIRCVGGATHALAHYVHKVHRLYPNHAMTWSGFKRAYSSAYATVAQSSARLRPGDKPPDLLG